MKSFATWLEWDEADFKRRHQFAELKLDLSGLPSIVEIFQDEIPPNKYPLSIRVDFDRKCSPYIKHTYIVIPYGKGQELDLHKAREVATQLVSKNKNRYSRVWAGRCTKASGQSFIYEENDNEYFN